jgi:hypothetical protein
MDARVALEKSMQNMTPLQNGAHLRNDLLMVSTVAAPAMVEPAQVFRPVDNRD